MVSRHRLWFGLRRYLIAFAPQTIALDQRKHTWRMPTLLLVLRESKNFTSCHEIPTPTPTPINHSIGSNQQQPMALCYSMLTYTDDRLL
jgi:hypothetical protein